MLELIGNIIKIVIFLLTWRVGVNESNEKKKSTLAQEASDAIASGRVSRINAVVAKLRQS